MLLYNIEDVEPIGVITDFKCVIYFELMWHVVFYIMLRKQG